MAKPILELKNYKNKLTKYNIERDFWFDISRYKFNSKRPDIYAFWCEQLLIRRFILNRQSKHKAFNQKNKDLAEKLKNQLIESPLIDLRDPADLILIGGPALLKIKSSISSIGSGIRILTVSDVMQMSKRISARNADKSSNRFFQNASDFLDGSNVVCAIDLDIPDKKIMSGIRNSLKVLRQELDLEENSKQRKIMLGNWKQNGILPFIDLMIWCKDNRVSLSLTLLSRMIFNNDARSDAVRKITRETAEFALSDGALNTLLSLANMRK